MTLNHLWVQCTGLGAIMNSAIEGVPKILPNWASWQASGCELGGGLRFAVYTVEVRRYDIQGARAHLLYYYLRIGARGEENSRK